MDAGAITSLLIIAACFAGLHTIVNLRQDQAKRLGVPYMDTPRRIVLAVALGGFAVYVGGVLIAVGLGW